MEDKKTKNSKETLKFIGVGVLVLAILGGTAVLLWMVEKQDSSSQTSAVGQENSVLQKQVDDLNQKIDGLNKAISDAKGQTQSTSSVQSDSAGGSTVPGAVGQVNLNTASLSELDTLTGIGPTYAQRIIDYRDQTGGFKTIDEIQNVKGIGPATFEKIKEQITI